jgi:tetratricopeptide (TPR) repeat protein
METNRLASTVEKYMRKGNVAAAVDQYLEALKQKPNDVTTINALGDLYVRVGKTEEAIRRFSTIADIHTDNGFPHLAIVMLKKALKLSPNHTESKKKLAHLYFKQGKLATANLLYMEIAQFFERLGNLPEALEFYERAAHCDATNPEVYLTIGKLHISKGQMKFAVGPFLKAGGIFAAAGETEQAFQVYIKVLYFVPDNLTALEALISLCEAKNEPQAAKHWIVRGLEKSKGDAELYLLASRFYLSIGDLDNAEKTLLAVTEKQPHHFTHHLEVCNQLLKKGEVRRSVECLRQTLDNLKDQTLLQRAVDFLHSVLEVDKAHLSALNALAQTYRKLRDEERLMTTLNALFEAAVEQAAEYDASKAMEEISLLLMKQSSSNQGTKKPLPKQIDIDCNEVFQLPTRIQESPSPTPSATILYPRFRISEAELSSAEAVSVGFNNSPVSQQAKSHLPAASTVASTLEHNQISSCSPAELHSLIGNMIASLNELLNHGSFNQAEESELAMQKSYFQAMQAFSTSLAQSMNENGEPINVAFAKAFLSSPVTPQRLAMMAAANEQVTPPPTPLFENLNDNRKPEYELIDSLADRRRIARSDLRIPLQVFFHDGRPAEETESLNLSKLGIRFRLKNRVTVGMPLRLEIALPYEFRLYECNSEVYTIEAIACQVSTGMSNQFTIGAEFGSLL